MPTVPIFHPKFGTLRTLSKIPTPFRGKGFALWYFPTRIMFFPKGRDSRPLLNVWPNIFLLFVRIPTPMLGPYYEPTKCSINGAFGRFVVGAQLMEAKHWVGILYKWRMPNIKTK